MHNGQELDYELVSLVESRENKNQIVRRGKYFFHSLLQQLNITQILNYLVMVYITLGKKHNYK